MKRTRTIFLFTTYSYALRLLFLLLDLLPHFIRVPFMRVMFAKLGKGPLIDYSCYFRYPSKIVIGDHVSINRGCAFYPSQQAQHGSITIGNHVAIGPHVRFFAAGHDHSQLHLPDTAAPITVGNHVWIGGNATILQGVTIGEGAVIGAGAVVTRDVPAYSVAAGSPARVLTQRSLTPQAGTVHDAAGSDV